MGNSQGEVPPPDVTIDSSPKIELGLHDSIWAEDDWHSLLETLVQQGMAGWREIASLVLGHLNPSQVGTSLASSAGFKRRYGKGRTMRLVMEWAYQQNGRCADCGSRLELQADHIRGREEFKDPLEADYIENMTLRCRRCNVIRRPSHEYGGKTFLTAEAALMWVLFVIKPRTLIDFIRLCRIYGMTMSDIRMQEAWAMAHWLSKDEPPAYRIEEDNKTFYDILLWGNGAVTRIDSGDSPNPGTTCIYNNIRGDYTFSFIVKIENGRMKLVGYPIGYIPFSSYELGELSGDSLAIKYTPPDRKKGIAQSISPLPPKGMPLVSHTVVPTDGKLLIMESSSDVGISLQVSEMTRNGKLLPSAMQGKTLRLVSA